MSTLTDVETVYKVLCALELMKSPEWSEGICAAPVGITTFG